MAARAESFSTRPGALRAKAPRLGLRFLALGSLGFCIVFGFQSVFILAASSGPSSSELWIY